MLVSTSLLQSPTGVFTGLHRSPMVSTAWSLLCWSQQVRPEETRRDQWRPVESCGDLRRPVETTETMQWRPVETCIRDHAW